MWSGSNQLLGQGGREAKKRVSSSILVRLSRLRYRTYGERKCKEGVKDKMTMGSERNGGRELVLCFLEVYGGRERNTAILLSGNCYII